MNKGWKTVKLKEVSIRIKDKNKGRSNNVLTISAQHGLVSQLDYFNKNVASKNLDGYYFLEKGDFAYNKSYSEGYPFGAIKILDKYEVGVVSTLYICFRMNESENVEFFKHYFDSNLWHNVVMSIAPEGGRSHGLLNVGVYDFFEINLTIPPVVVQKKISEILTTVDDVIEKTKAIIEQTKKVKKGLMQQLLTKGIGHTKFKTTEIGEIPEGWATVLLEDLTSDSAFGPRFPADQYDVNGNFALLRTTDIDGNWEINYDTMPIAQLPESKFQKHILQEGDLLVTRSGTCGVVSVFKEYVRPVIPGAFLIRFRLNHRINPEFLRLFMMTDIGQSKIQLMASGGVQKNLSGTNLKKLIIPLPSLIEQNKIVTIVSSLDTKIKNELQKNKQLLKIKHGLMHVLLTGKVRVKVDEEEVVTS